MLPRHQGTTTILSSVPNLIGRPGHSLHDLCFAAISRICAAQFKGDGGIAQNLTVFRRQMEELLHRQIALDAVIHVVHQEVAVGDLADGVIDQILVRLAFAPVNRGFFQTVGVQAALLVVLGQRAFRRYTRVIGEILGPRCIPCAHNVFAQVLERKLIRAGLPLRRPVGHGEGGHIRPAVRPAVGRGVRIVCGFRGLRGYIAVPGAGLPAGGNVIRQTALQREGHVRQILPGKAAGQGGPQLLPHQGHIILNGIGEGAAGAQGVVVALAIAVWGTGHAIQAQHIALFNIQMVGFRSGVGISPHGVRFSQAVAHIICCVGAPSGGAVVLCSAVQDGKLLPGAELDLSAIHRHGGILHDLVVEAGCVHRGALHGVVVDGEAVVIKGIHVFQGQRPGVVVSVSLPVAAAAHVLDPPLICGGGLRLLAGRGVGPTLCGSGSRLSAGGGGHRHVHHPVDVQVQVGTQAALVGVVVHPHLGPGDVLGRVPPVGDFQRLDVQRVLAVHIIFVIPFEFRVRVVAPQGVEVAVDVGVFGCPFLEIDHFRLVAVVGRLRHIQPDFLHGVGHGVAVAVVLGQAIEVGGVAVHSLSVFVQSDDDLLRRNLFGVFAGT